MYPALRWKPLLGVIALFVKSTISVSTATALSVTPSTEWYGDDGTWSAVSIRIGTPAQWVDVMVSTVSSETWAVGPGGCNNNSLCASMRGGLFNPSTSSTWQPEGFFELGVDQQLGNTGYADYGLDNVTFGSTGVVLPSAIIGSINDTNYWLGYFGLGIVPGNFTNITAISAISGLVEKEDAIPSHSYGYTAGAKYQQKGEPNSLTLGGYDANRFVPNNASFELNPSQEPQAFVNSISVISSATSNNWTTSQQLLYTADRVSAIIDSSTPYLWLPQSVCDRFADSLGLSYNSTLDLYTFDSNASQHDALENAQLTFTFSLSDVSSSSEVVNITLPYAAFDQQLTFPFIANTSYGSPDSQKYYFPIRPATTEAQYTIGRVFLQEAYLITDYERNNFSVHQAVHTADPIGNTSIVSILRPSTSSFSGPKGAMSGHKAISTGAIVGIAVGAAVGIGLLSFAIFYFCRRRQHRDEVSDDEKATESPPRGLLARFRRPRPALVHEATGSTNYPTEVGADATHERYELPAPLGPAELDSESGTLDGTTERGSSTQDSANLSAYERARRKLERQQAAAAQAQPTHETYPVEKSENDVSAVAHYRPPSNSDVESPLVSPVGAESGSGGSLTISGQPSPVSPGFVSAPTSPISPPPTYRRISPGNVVYAGRLPDNVQLPQIVPRIIGPDGRTIRAEETMVTEPNTSTLGSHYTEDEDVSEDLYGSGSSHSNREASSDPDVGTDLYGSGSTRGVNIRGGSGGHPEADESKFLREDMQSLRADMQTREILDPWSSRRRLAGEDLVHVPQPAANRFSWEEERISGNEESL